MTATVSETAAVPAGFDFASPDLMAERIPLAEFALLRRTGAPWWNAQPRGATGFDDDGFWVISRHAHIKEISRDHEQWSSNARGAVIRFNETFSPHGFHHQRPSDCNMMVTLGTAGRGGNGVHTDSKPVETR